MDQINIDNAADLIVVDEREDNRIMGTCWNLNS